MILYVRLINKIRWENVASLSNLSGEAITEDWRCIGNEWSVFQFEGSLKALRKDPLLDSIVLRMVADNVKKTQDGVDLLVLDNGFINSIQSRVERDKKSKLNSYHCNICDITYGKIQKAIKYTYRNRNMRVISYSMRDIRDLISNATSDFLIQYKSYVSEKNNTKLINRAFNVKL